jgi:glucose-1-phosphate thymidylyltransferase
MKGIILAGGTGSRLYPNTAASNKHLLPVYDKPMIYFPLSTLIMAGIKDVVIVSNAEYISLFKNLLADGAHLGINLSYTEQPKSDGIVGALISAANLVKDSDALVILGDNVFFGGGFGATLEGLSINNTAKIWVKQVGNPKDYGILSLDPQGRPVSVEEKPKTPKSNLAITGLYYFPKEFVSKLSEVSASARGEYEITSLIEGYLKDETLEVKNLRRGTAWFDAGTSDRLFTTSDFVRIIQERTGQIVGSPEEVTFRQGNISIDELKSLIHRMPTSTYKTSLTEMMDF